MSTLKRTFRIVAIKGHGAFENFATEVPDFARQLLHRTREIENHTNIEIALFEPKMNDDHLEGHYYVGILVKDRPSQVPKGMEYLEVSGTYVSAEGSIDCIDLLYNQVGQWRMEQNLTRDWLTYIVETYHPTENGEDVEVFLPVLDPE
ncbi:GyrI-like domain-containing protein [Halobacillus sp. Nhm2S1]|uniref:GyrI-like domain-containing protein n=1 Tax=Halobacillus sp. Nhm2S1 TaxID=2866716 RepID=UPI001C72AFFC|nr:AraC family transcriptional regulator [Halobacillus sp. Nhm2S1]MBX0356778.1 AraC family transcriptional regulator [Halobacillus sp. Nhm2S1]